MDSKDNILCRGCLSSERKMHVIQEHWKKQCFLQIISETSVYQSGTEQVTLCWECVAQLQNFAKFKQKVMYSHKTLNDHIKQNTNYRDIDIKPRLTVHRLMNLSLLSTIENTETIFQVITPENNILDEFNDTLADTYSDDDKLILRRRKKGYIPKKKTKKNGEVQLCEEDKSIVNVESEKCEQCLTNFNNKDDMNSHLCIKQEPDQKRESFNGKIRKRKRKSNEIQLFKEVELSRDELEEERRLAVLREDYVNAMFKCHRCIVCFANAEDLKDHISIKHELNSSKFKCDICECSFASEVSYNYHASKHARRYECGACSTRSCSKRAAAKHYELYHCRGTVFEYDIQDGNLDNEHDANRKEVNSAKLANREFPCELCDKSFRWKTSLRKHAETHRIETGQKRKPYCEPCRLSFTTTSNLQKHVKTSSKHQIQLKLRKLKESLPEDAATPEKEQARIDQIKCSVNTARQVFPCPQCDKKFQWRGNMLRHLNSHAARAKGELVCEPCNRTFSSIATYKQHMKISRKHVSENDFKYMCSDCGKRFANKTRLKDHINWEHLKNYVHTCSVCQKIFKSHTSLYLHKQVVHKKDNAEHLCHYCGKAFPNQAKLRAHMRAAHSGGGAAYACGTCGARFSWLSCLSRHARRAHKHNS